FLSIKDSSFQQSALSLSGKFFHKSICIDKLKTRHNFKRLSKDRDTQRETCKSGGKISFFQNVSCFRKSRVEYTFENSTKLIQKEKRHRYSASMHPNKETFWIKLAFLIAFTRSSKL